MSTPWNTLVTIGTTFFTTRKPSSLSSECVCFVWFVQWTQRHYVPDVRNRNYSVFCDVGTKFVNYAHGLWVSKRQSAVYHCHTHIYRILQWSLTTALHFTDCSNSGAYLQGVQTPYNNDTASVSFAEYYNEVWEQLCVSVIWCGNLGFYLQGVQTHGAAVSRSECK